AGRRGAPPRAPLAARSAELSRRQPADSPVPKPDTSEAPRVALVQSFPRKIARMACWRVRCKPDPRDLAIVASIPKEEANATNGEGRDPAAGRGAARDLLCQQGLGAGSGRQERGRVRPAPRRAGPARRWPVQE